MAALITGGYGHIGSWIAHLMAERGDPVILVDSVSQAPDHLEAVSENITFVQGDVTDYPGLADIFRRYRDRIDGVIHTVGIMAEFVIRNPHKNVMVNIGGFLNVLELARQFGIEKVVYTSTGAVYGALNGIASEERHLPNPADLYGATKASCEHLGTQYANHFGIDFRASRLYFVYGPGRTASGFIRLYTAAFGALEGLKGIDLPNGADQKLDFTHVEDAALGTMLLYDARHPKHKVYNIATGEGSSVGRVLELTKKHSRYPHDVSIGPGTLMPRAEALDITRAETDLGFKPKFELEAGIEQYARWFEAKNK